MALDIKALIAKAGLTGDAAEAAQKAFSSEALTTAIEEEAMHKANAAFETDKAKMKENWETANREYMQMQEELKTVRADADSTKAERDASAAKLKEAEKKVTELSSVDLGKLKTEILAEAKQSFGEFEVGARSIELDALECVSEHQQLFGQKLSVKTLVTEALAAKKAPADYWNEKYNVSAKREEIAKAAHDKELADHGKKVLDEYIAAQSNPATRTMTDSRNPFYTPAADPTKTVQPWDMTDQPSDETALMNELSRARVQ